MVWISSWLREVEVEGLSLDIRYCWLLSTHTLNRASGVPTYAKINPLDTRAPRSGWIFIAVRPSQVRGRPSITPQIFK